MSIKNFFKGPTTPITLMLVLLIVNNTWMIYGLWQRSRCVCDRGNYESSSTVILGTKCLLLESASLWLFMERLQCVDHLQAEKFFERPKTLYSKDGSSCLRFGHFWTIIRGFRDYSWRSMNISRRRLGHVTLRHETSPSMEKFLSINTWSSNLLTLYSPTKQTLVMFDVQV